LKIASSQPLVRTTSAEVEVSSPTAYAVGYTLTPLQGFMKVGLKDNVINSHFANDVQDSFFFSVEVVTALLYWLLITQIAVA
jgi:hypothetical protein